MTCPVPGVEITETALWVDGEYVMGLNVLCPELSNEDSSRLFDWLKEEYGDDGWVLGDDGWVPYVRPARGEWDDASPTQHLQ